jgi:hypothetical protein
MRIGYARVSTDDQTLDLQRDALAKCRQIYKEHASGKTTIRPELDACLKSLRKDDTLVVWRLDRLGRSLGDLIHLTTELRSRGVDFESLTERIETGSSAGKLIFHVFASLAEFERARPPRLVRESSHSLSVADYYERGGTRWLRFQEKRGKEHEVPVHSKAKEAVDLWLERSSLASNPSAPLFPSFAKNRETIEQRRLDRRSVLKLVEKRARTSGILKRVCCHTFLRLVSPNT